MDRIDVQYFKFEQVIMNKLNSDVGYTSMMQQPNNIKKNIYALLIRCLDLIDFIVYNSTIQINTFFLRWIFFFKMECTNTFDMYNI